MGSFSYNSFRCFFIMTGITKCGGNTEYLFKIEPEQLWAITSAVKSKISVLARQMFKTTNPFKSGLVFFAIEWINSAAWAGRDSYCMYSHTLAFNHLSSPLWLTYLFSFPLNKKKIRSEDETAGEEHYLSKHVSLKTVKSFWFSHSSRLIFVLCSSNLTMLVQINL